MAVKKIVSKSKTTWSYSFRVRGIRYRGAIPEARNKQQAEIAETRIRNDIFDGKFGAKQSNLKLRDFVRDVFLPWAKANRQSWRKDASRLKPIVDFFGEKRLNEISPFLVEKFKIIRKATPITFGNDVVTGKPVTRPRSVASVNRELGILSRIFSIAITNNQASINPCSSGKVKKLKGEQPRTRYLLPEEEERLFAVLTGSRVYLKTIVILLSILE